MITTCGNCMKDYESDTQSAHCPHGPREVWPACLVCKEPTPYACGGCKIDGNEHALCYRDPCQAAHAQWHKENCKHQDFHIHGNFSYLEDIDQFMLDLSVKCKQCDTPFHFIGFDFGCLLNRPAMSVDGTELRLPIAPGALKIDASGTAKFGVM
jgi:hypothetical protein